MRAGCLLVTVAVAVAVEMACLARWCVSDDVDVGSDSGLLQPEEALAVL